MKETEEFIPTQLDDFFTHFRDKDTRAWKDLSFVLKTQPITASSTVNIPYYRDGNPTDTCATVSTGGAHGNIVEGLHLKCPAQIRCLDPCWRSTNCCTKTNNRCKRRNSH